MQAIAFAKTAARIGGVVTVTLVLLGFAQLRGDPEPESGTEAPVSLVITYHARPESRTAFRAWMRSSGLQRFEGWKRDGVFRSYHLFWTAYAAGGPMDLTAVLDFSRFTDTAAWRRIERQDPGGLDSEAVKLASASNSALCDRVAASPDADAFRPDSTYLLTEYTTLVDNARYDRYATSYVIPQLQGWIDAGVLAGYALYVTQNPGAPYDALLVLEYKDYSALARRDTVKDAVRRHLAETNPTWKAASLDKGDIRKETAVIFADRVERIVPMR